MLIHSDMNSVSPREWEGSFGPSRTGIVFAPQDDKEEISPRRAGSGRPRRHRPALASSGAASRATRLQEKHSQRFFRGAGVGLFDPPKTCFKLCPILPKADGVGVAFGLEECVRAFI